jgi:hypothetical protein
MPAGGVHPYQPLHFMLTPMQVFPLKYQLLPGYLKQASYRTLMIVGAPLSPL